MRKNLDGVSTTLTVMNASATRQDYSVSYVDYSGHPIRSDEFSLNANQTVTLDQLADQGLPPFFEGAARIINLSRGSLPIVEVQTFGGTFSAPPQPVVTLSPPFPTPALVFLPIVLPSTNIPSGW